MVVLDAVGEEEIEPVRVVHLCLAQVRRASSRRISQREEPRCGIVLGQHLVHLAVHTRLGGVGRLGIVQISLLLQFLIYRHLVL